MSERKKTTIWPQIAAVVLALPVLYPLSFGLWLATPSHPADALLVLTFEPMMKFTICGPDWIVRPYLVYLEQCNADEAEAYRSFRIAHPPGL